MTSDRAVSWRAPIRLPPALWMAIAVSALLIVTGIVAISVTDLPDHIGQSEPGSVSPKPPLAPEPEKGQGTADSQDQTTQVPPAEPAPFDGVRPDAERSQATTSEGDRTSIVIPASPNITPPPSSDASTPAAKAPKAKRPALPKARKDHKEVPTDKWIQTR